MRFIVWFLCLGLIACESPPSKALYQFTGNAMTMDYRILIGHPLTESQQELVETIILDVFNEINVTYNKWNPQSEISRLNQQKSHTQIPLSPQLEKFLSRTDQVVHLSDGKFDPTVESIQAIWREAFASGTLPTKEALQPLLPSLGWHQIHIDYHHFWKEHDLTQIDLGGIAKGLGVDFLVEKLKIHFSNIYVEWGGEIRTAGYHPDQRRWRVSISNSPIEVELENQAIATSGNYLQKWEIEETTYCHIVDPNTGIPLKVGPQSIFSASVRASNCALADGLATAAMLFSDLNEAKKWTQKMEELDPTLTFWLIAQDDSS